MKDIPNFTTEDGVSSLFLKEIPYRGVACVQVWSVQPGGLSAHLAECVQFCRAAGAETVYATGHSELTAYPLHHIVEQMSAVWEDFREPPAGLFPVTANTAGLWRTYYNEKMRDVDHAATLTAWDERELTQSSGAYFVHRDGTLLGIGWLEGERLSAVAACVPGMGETVVRTLLSAASQERITLEVSSTNHRAKSLYQRLGFVKTGETARWYRVFGKETTQ